MSTAIKTAMTDNSAKDNTGDAINGSEVDLNPNTLADILDGTTGTDLGGAGAVDFLALRSITLANAAGSIQRPYAVEWDPADGNDMTDNSSGLGISFKMPDDATNQDTFCALDIMVVSDATTAEEGELSVKLVKGGTLTEILTLAPTTGLTLGVNDIGYDVKLFGATSGKSWLWDESADKMIVTGDASISGTMTQTGVLTASAGIVSGGNIVSDSDGADDLGTTSVRWDDLFVDDVTVTTTVTAGTSVIGGTMTVAGGSLTDSSGAISFGNENLSTTGTMATGALTVTGALLPNADNGGALGASGTEWSDLFLHTGGVINWEAGNATITHSNNALTMAVTTFALTGAQTVSSTLAVTGTTTLTGALTTGVSGTGVDVTFYGDTAGQYLKWDQSDDELVLAGDTKLSFHDAAGGENIIATSNGHLEINAGTTLDITAPTVDLNSSTEFNIDTAAYDLNASGDIELTSTNDAADAIYLRTNAGTSETIKIHADQGTSVTEGASSVQVLSDAGGVELKSTANLAKSIKLIADGGTSETIYIQADQGTGAGSITLVSDAGGIDVDAVGISLDASAASNLTTSSGALTITSAAAATWSTAAGALTITSAAAATWSTAAGNLTITSAGVLTANGTTGVAIQEGGEDIITISNARAIETDNTASIDLDASGAITMNSSGGTLSIGSDNVDQVVNLATAGTRTLNVGINDGTDITTIVSKGNITNTGTLTVGVNDAGHDVKFFGATASKSWLWDESIDKMIVTGDASISGTLATAALTATSLSVGDGNITNVGSIALDSITGDADSNTDITFAGSDVITITTGGTERVRINSDGLFLVASTTSVPQLGGNVMKTQFNGTGTTTSSISLSEFSAGAAGPNIILGSARGGSVGTYTAANTDDALGSIFFCAADGTDLANWPARISAFSETNASSNSTSAYLAFATGSNTTAATERMRINSAGDTLISNGGGLVIGHTAQVAPNGLTPELQVLGTAAADSALVLGMWSADADGPYMLFTKSRNTTIGSNTIVVDDDNLGHIRWAVDDGTDYVSYAAGIDAYIDGTPGNNDVPGRLVFSTTADGASAPTERMRISSDGKTSFYSTGEVITAGSGLFNLINTGTSTGGSATMRFQCGDSSDFLKAGFGFTRNSSTYGTGYLSFSVDSNDDAANVDAAGGSADEKWRITNVGVWTSTGSNPSNAATTKGAVLASGGIAFSDVANAWIDDSTRGSGTVTHYIGNETIDTTSSDVRLKENITIPNGAAFKHLQVLSGALKEYDYKNGTGHFVGLPAQDVDKLLPQYVVGDEEQYSLRYHYMVGPLLWGWQDQEARIKQLESRIKLLEVT